MAKDWKKQTRAPVVGMIRNPYFVFPDSFEVGTTPTLLDAKEAQKVINFIRAIMLGRVHITTGNPLKNLMEFHLSKENGLIDLQIKTALINDLDPYLGNHLNLEGYNLDARDISGSMYQQHGDEGFCISGGQSGGVIRLLGGSTNGVSGGSGFADGGADVIWTLPTNSGSSGQVLSTDGLKGLSWITAGGGGGGSGTVTSVATSVGTFVDVTGGDPSPITTTGTISADLSATGSASATTFLRGDNVWAVPAGSGTSPAGSTYEVQIKAADGSFGAAGVFATTSGELQFGSAAGSEAINLNAADSIIKFDNFPSGDFKQGIEFYYGYRIVESYPTSSSKGLSFVKEEGGSDHCIMDLLSRIPFVGGDLRSVSIGHSHHEIDGNLQTGTFLDIDGQLLLRGADPASDDGDWVSLKAQTGSEGYVIGLPVSDYSGFGYRNNMVMCIKSHSAGTQDLDWKNVLITDENSLAVQGETGLYFKGWNASAGASQSKAIMNGDVLEFVAGGSITIDYTSYGLGSGGSSTHKFTIGGGGGGGGSGTVTSVAAANGTFVNLSGGPITASGTLTPDLSATGTASSSTFLRGDNTWAVPSGGGGGGMTSFDFSDPFLNSFSVTNSDTVSIESADASVSIDCSTAGIIDLSASGGGGGSGTVTSVDCTSSVGTIICTGGPITSSGTLDVDLATTTVTAGDYILASITVNDYGQITAASDGQQQMEYFNVEDGSANQFQVYDVDTIVFDSSDGSIDIDASYSRTVDFSVSGGGGPSDERLKKNIESVGGLLGKVEKLQPVEFDWNEEAASTFKKEGHEIGLVAQDVEKIFPDLVGDRKGFKTVDYEKLVPMLVDCIKDLSHQVRTLNEKVDDLEFKNLTDQ